MAAGAIAAAAGQVLGQGLNAWSTGRQNRKSREWSEKMYGRQRDDSIEFWNMQNEYNSPHNQMARLREAGLNPNLMYGQGNTGNAPSMPSQAETPRPEFNPAMIGSGLMELSQIYDFELKQAQTNNLQAMEELNIQKAFFENVKTLHEYDKKHITGSQRMWSDTMAELSVDHMRASLHKIKADTQYTLDQNERAQAMLEPNMQNIIESILTKRMGREVSSAVIKNLGFDSKIKEAQARIANFGITPGSPQWLQIVGWLLGTVQQGIENETF